MPGQEIEGDIGPFQKGPSDLDACQIHKVELEMQLRELDVKLTELEEREKHWQEERKIILRRAKDEQ